MKKFINKIKNNPKLYFLSILIVGVFFVLVVRITFAYLAPAINKAQSEVVGTSDTVDDFKFGLGNPIKIDATPTTLPENGTNYVSSTTATAYLKANSTNKSATFNYFVYFQIETNTFKYSNGTTPEIILTVTDPNGNELTSLSGLTYGTFSGISGFDITTKSGIFDIATNYEITSNSSNDYTNQTWTFTVTYLNLPFDQSLNFGNNMTVNVYIKKEQIPTSNIYHEACNDNTLACHVAKLYTGTQGENSIYYHDANLENGANDNSYRYTGSRDEVNNFVCFGINESPCPTKNLYRIIGVFGDNYHGVKGKHLVKLIKYDYTSDDLLGSNYENYTLSTDSYIGELDTAEINAFYWNGGSSSSNNIWKNSLLNTSYLNRNYLDNSGTEWSNKIATTTWKVSGNTYSNIGNVDLSVLYQNEVVSPETGGLSADEIEYEAKIGLMYASDYGYAASPASWLTTLENVDNLRGSSWIYMGLYEWTITRLSADEFGVFSVTHEGIVYPDSGVATALAVRPVFFLVADTQYVSGHGTQSDPMIIN